MADTTERGTGGSGERDRDRVAEPVDAHDRSFAKESFSGLIAEAPKPASESRLNIRHAGRLASGAVNLWPRLPIRACDLEAVPDSEEPMKLWTRQSREPEVIDLRGVLRENWIPGGTFTVDDPYPDDATKMERMLQAPPGYGAFVAGQLADICNVGLLRMMRAFGERFSLPQCYMTKTEALEAARAYQAENGLSMTVMCNVVFSPAGYRIVPKAACDEILRHLALDKRENLREMRRIARDLEE